MKNINYIIITALTVLCIYLWRNGKEAQNTAKNNIAALTDSITLYQTKHGAWVAEKSIFQGTEKDLRQIIKSKDKAFQKLIKSFKKPIAAALIKTITKIDTVFIPYEEKNQLPEFEFNFKANTEYYTINGTSTEKGINIWNLFFPNTQSLVIGKKRIGFLKYGYKINVENSNLNIKTTNVDGFDFRPKPKRFSVGFFAGYSTRLEPVIGAGISYNLLLF
tara:strand:+ start:56 stop:712 length:657 start_codon:yes stop_codon:yes gene_type:complete